MDGREMPLKQDFRDFRERLENLAVRSNGQLLLDSVSKPHMYGIDPSRSNAKPTLLHEFSNVTNVLGIAEIAPDIFAVIAGNWSNPAFHQPGSFSIWTIDLNPTGSKPPRKPKLNLVTAMPDANALNGMTTLAGSPNMVLVADSVLGAIWRLNITTGTYQMVIQSPLFTGEGPQSIGINGIRTYEGKVYFFNSHQRTYVRVPVKPDGTAAGEVEILARVDPPSLYDDFDMDWEGNAWVATHANALTEITIEGK